MSWSTRQGRIAAAAVFAVLALVLLARLSAYGIWDPWELEVADLGRKIAAGEPVEGNRSLLGPWLTGLGFRFAGTHEWSGRLPGALFGLLLALVSYLTVARFTGRRAGLWAAIVTGTAGLTVLSARQMLGEVPAMVASSLVFFCAMAAVFAPAPLTATRSARLRATGLWLAGLLGAVALGVLAAGLLRAVTPPLLAVGAAILARGELRHRGHDPLRTGSAAVVLALALGCLVISAQAVAADQAGYSWITGSFPRGGNPPGWQAPIVQIFHAFVPWSALLPLALAGMLVAPPRGEMPSLADPRLRPVLQGPRLRGLEEGALRQAVVLWAAFALASQTLFMARYGPASYLGGGALAGGVALFLHDIERRDRGHGGLAVVSFFLALLLVRDFRLYPVSPVAALPLDSVSAPEGFSGTAGWAITILPFAFLLSLGLYVDPRGRSESLREDWAAVLSAPSLWGRLRALFSLGFPTRLLAAQWRIREGWGKTGLGIQVGVLAILLVGAWLFGLLSLLIPDTLASLGEAGSLVPRIGRWLFALVPALFVLVAVARLTMLAMERLGSYRLVPAIALSFAVAGYTAQGFLPALSSHFSPREVYDSYNQLAQSGEPLGEWQVGTRAAAYYVDGEIEDLDNMSELVAFLRRPDRVWAAFRAQDLASVDRNYREHEGEHLFVADARSARVILATNQPIEGRENQSFLSGTVLDEVPAMQHRVGASFDDKIELLGYDLELPHGSYVGPGEEFSIVWYWRSVAPVRGSYQIFLHIDGPGVRIHGDHVPVDDKYPVRVWEPGDIIVDRQTLRVPLDYQRGDLTMFIGFYAGESRLSVVRGDHDGENRLRAGRLRIR